MARLFGTDGVRGVANTQLTCDLAFKLGQAAVAFQGTTILIGKDTRLSGDMLESSVAAGIMSMGGTALLAGIIPTPAIALLVRELHCDGGIVISASHNPPEYNGIKLFDGQGFKLPDAVEDEIAAFVARGVRLPTSCRLAMPWACRFRWRMRASSTSRMPCPRWPTKTSISRASKWRSMWVTVHRA